MKKILMALGVFAFVITAASAQTKPAKTKADAPKECHQAKKEECVKKEEGSCCMPSSKVKAISTAKKPAAKKA